MQATQSKRDIEYTLVLSEDEANLLLSILGNQWTNQVGPVQRMYDSLSAAGARHDQWEKQGGEGYDKDKWVRKDNR